jgi:ABC-2 type transport system permease protein
MYKDFLVLIRDRGGLAMLFVMPAALVMIMTSLQDTTFRSLNESGIKMLVLNHDQDSLGLTIERELTRSTLFTVNHTIDNFKPTQQQVKEAVASGKFQIGIIIPEDATRRIRMRISRNVQSVFSGNKIHLTDDDTLNITVYLDPITKSAFRTTLQGQMKELTARIEKEVVLSELAREINSRMMIPLANTEVLKQEVVTYREEYAVMGNRSVIPNSTQHNVPAWTLFAIFFIVIPFAGAMIREREEGSLARLLTMPCSRFSILLSRAMVYLVVCYLQFMLIMAMGVYLFPMIDLPPLMISGKLAVLSLLALSSSLAAIGYGIAIATVAHTHQQASIFGSISVVILAAIGGIWVPVFVMPSVFRQFSVASPLNWGLNGFYDVLVRGAGLPDVLPNCLYLLVFAMACMGFSLYYQRSRKDFI